MKALFRGPDGQVSTAALLAAAGYPEAPARQLPEAIRLWQEAEAAERARAAEAAGASRGRGDENGARPGESRDARRMARREAAA